MDLPLKLRQKLAQREQNGILRQLKTTAAAIDFCSNDYLGLARSQKLRARLEAELLNYAHLPVGATGSRLLSGNSALAEALEKQIAQFHAAKATLLFNSGFAANTGFFSAIPQRGDTILYDEASHASIKDGIRLSFAQSFSFRHNSPDDLQKKFQRATGDVYVAVESLYSMDGDFAPLIDLVQICAEKGAYLVVDEAHSNGLYGPNGGGLVQELGLADKVFARIMTFGKALGCHGAAMVGSEALRQFLINFSRPFIYTTALPLHALLNIKTAYELLPELNFERSRVKQLAVYLKNALAPYPNIKVNPTDSPIQWLQAPDVASLRTISQKLQADGIDARPIFSPTVPAGKERLRLIVHAFNTEAEIDALAAAISTQL
ncbi:aminotransferase class I/II-fold pyridoxal phosphate-dependent enzyme [Adhaeribacter rhizoryzae]|uniref:8-amino-7-oxononanoate synthase n=1 Tax=Adhaeribacter rhizoryzae TaxID=2607907 RepID=A0A5M6D4V6_9BACT|nr:8-amino-7-oxononanoate synthase [Adhaeribacter rhizoryzae]KAA5540799.1 8-amino-7-oxononanoate synthase [Adhaeribacter rhizoryzae]